ncbi:unnamed protein product [Ixodes persulcatus]
MAIEESSNDETVVQKRRQETKKDISQSAAKKKSYKRILKKKKNAPGSQKKEKKKASVAWSDGGRKYFSRKRVTPRQIPKGPSAHDSEMRQAENSFWKEKCTPLQEDNLFLQKQLKGNQRFSALKSFNLEWEHRAKGSVMAATDTVDSAALMPHHKSKHCSAQKKKKSASTAGPSTSKVARHLSHATGKLLMPTCSVLKCIRRIALTSFFARKFMQNKKATTVAKGTAQAIWIQAVLARRTVKGALAPNKNG